MPGYIIEFTNGQRKEINTQNDKEARKEFVRQLSNHFFDNNDSFQCPFKLYGKVGELLVSFLQLHI